MNRPTARRRLPRIAALATASVVALSGCGFSPYELPLPGGANVGDEPFEITVEFRDVLDLVPQSAVKVDDVAVGKVTKVELTDWTAKATLSVNRDVVLPDNAEATLRQSSLLGEKFVNLAAPEGGGNGTLGDGDTIGLQRSGRNPDIEEVLGAASLLLNGGAIEKTNTIVKELSNALDGNESEVKELLQTSSEFIGQLDANKESLLTALEKVNNLALATSEQEDAITAALDDLPEALEVLDDQRDDLVVLLESLDGLGGVATDLIRRTREDTLAVLRDLAPTLQGLADAGDDLAKATEILLTFPFTDGILGGPNDRIGNSQSCSNDTPPDELACFGDLANLDINLTLNATQVADLVEGLLSIPGALLEKAGEAGAAPSAEEGAESDPTAQLVELVGGLTAPDAGGGDQERAPTPTPSSRPGSGSATDPAKPAAPGFCSLLGSCRTSTTNLAAAQQSDIGRLVVGPVVAR